MFHISHYPIATVLTMHVFMKEYIIRGFANNTGADQTAHLCSLISAFVTRFLNSIIYKHATGEISIFYLVSVAVEIGLKLALSETPKTGFLTARPIFTLPNCYCAHNVCFHEGIHYLSRDM